MIDRGVNPFHKGDEVLFENGKQKEVYVVKDIEGDIVLFHMDNEIMGWDYSWFELLRTAEQLRKDKIATLLQ